ncbi:MAG: alpha/beta fold hydrolase [Polyangiaceae bacterium]|nr:alpha/beta fold hydrolase [Polyangiaceae bacterium]
MPERGAPVRWSTVARAYARQARASTLGRAELLAELDRSQAQRGRPNHARRFEPERLEVGGPSLALEHLDPGDARATVVFSPGTNAYALLYADFLVALAGRGFRVVGYDPRGHGRSGGARGSYTLPELVDDLDRVVRHVSRSIGGPIVVAGSSQGGIACFYYAARGAEVAAAICHNAADLADPESFRLTRIPPRLSRRAAPALRALARIAPELPVPVTAYLDLAREPVRGLGDSRRALYTDRAIVPFVRLKTLASLSREPLARPVEQIAVPILLLHGGEDSIFPRDYIERLYDRLRCPKRLALYEGLPHYLIVDHVEVFLDDVVRFLDEQLRAAVAAGGAAR